MKKALLLLSMLGIAGLFAACAPAGEGPALQPAEGKLTFAFFYTDG